MSALLTVTDLAITYGPRRKRATTAPTVSGVGFELESGTAIGVVGESGSGKSTIARAIAGLLPYDGEITLDGTALPELRPPALRRRIQMVFQDPTSSLNPSIRVDRAIMQVLPPKFSGTDAQRERAHDLLRRVRLPERLHSAWPSELSGGQRQRVAIARALATEPAVLIADEATSALDVSVQATILELFNEVRETTGIGVVFISHDLTVVRATCEHVVVMQNGVTVEQGPVDDVYSRPRHPYTRALIAAVPRVNPRTPSEPVDRWVRPGATPTERQ